MTSPDLAARHQAIAARELLFCFTSLGDNCEFGLVQRRAGAEPLELFRFAFSGIDPMIESVRDGFADLDPLSSLVIEQPWNEEYISRFGARGFYRHTRAYPDGGTDPAVLRQEEERRIPFLRRCLLDDLQSAETIFVRKSNEHAPDKMRALFEALRRHGPNLLLWVEPADARHAPGTVERIENGLLRGYVDRFAPYGDATAISFDCWLSVCARSYQMLRGALPAAAPVADAMQIGRNAGLCGLNEVECMPGRGVVPLQPDEAVFIHPARQACNDVVAVLIPAARLQAQQTHTASIWVWVPDNFRGRLITPVFTRSSGGIAQSAILTERNRWQRIWVSGFIADEDRIDVAIWADMDAGDSFCSTCWTVEQAQHPGTYLFENRF